MAGGRPARFVGGCVRDGLLGLDQAGRDLDLATPEPPEQVIALLEAAGLQAIPTGLAHGTVTAVADARRFEITTLRRDVATDGRHASVAFTDDFEADAARRDFTINAMSCDRDGRLFDYFGGRADLAAGRVRFVGPAAARIAEDYLRILRFFRFLAHYGRLPADAEALPACAAAAPAIARLSGERVQAEMRKLLAATDPAAGAGADGRDRRARAGSARAPDARIAWPGCWRWRRRPTGCCASPRCCAGRRVLRAKWRRAGASRAAMRTGCRR